MSTTFIIGLIQNAALLVALSTLYALVRRFRETQSRWTPWVMGLLFGVVTLLGMRMPVRYTEGIIYDGRSIVLTLAGVFGGGVTALVAGAIALIYRLALGGPGVWAGSATIIACAGLGWAFRRRYRHDVADLRLGDLYGLGVVTHLAMLACQLLIQPWPRGVEVVRTIGLPIMLIFPPATVLLGLLLRSEEQRIRGEQRLASSEARYRTFFESAGDALLLLDGERFVECNQRALELFGATREALVGATPFAFSPPLQPDDRPSDEAARQHLQDALNLGYTTFEWRHHRLDGTPFDAEVTLSRIVANGRTLLQADVRDITEKKRTQSLLQRMVRLYAILAKLNETLTQSRTPAELLSDVCYIAVEQGELAGAWIGLRENDSARLVPFTWAGTVEPYLEQIANCLGDHALTPEPTCQALRTGRPVFLGNLLTCERFPWVEVALAQGYRAMAAVPFRYGTQQGVLSVYAPIPGFFAEPEEQLVLTEMATDLTFALDVMAGQAERQRLIQELRESEATFRAMFEKHAAIKLLIDPDSGAILDANEAAAAFYGWTREQLRTMYIQQINTLPPEAVKAEMERAKRAQRIYFEFRHRRADGSVRDVTVFSSGVPYRGKTILYSIIHDVTAAKAAERALQERERELATLLSNLPGMAYRCHNDPYWTMEFVSEGALALTGYAPDDLIHNRRLSYADLIVPEDRAKVWVAVQEAFLADVPYELTYRIRTAHNEVRWVWERGRAVYDAEGGIRFLEGFIMDITESYLAREAEARLLAQLQQQAADIERILDAVPEGVIVLDADYRLVRANPVGEGYLTQLAPRWEGEALKELGGRALPELLASPPAEGLWHELRVEKRIFELLARPLHDPPAPPRWLLVLRDVTEAREVQDRLQHQERLATVGQLAAGIAHDFNNILAAILLYADIGQRTPGLSPRLLEALLTIRQEAQRAAELVQQILDFGRRSILKRQAVDVKTFLQETGRFLERTLPETIRVQLNLPDEPCPANLDPTRMQQVLINLAINARDAMPRGGDLFIGLRAIPPDQPIHCHFCGTLQGDPWLAITVRDTGTGIPPEVLPRIFEPFFTTKEVGKGTGLGLAQVYGIVELHQGHLDLETAVGEGTTFTIYLPPLPQAEAVAPGEMQANTFDGAQRLILVVEDAPALRRALADTLKSFNFRVVTAAHGEEALSLLDTYPDITLVLSDVVMPGMDGRALLAALRERPAAPPLILLSGHPLEHELARLEKEGVAGWLMKPVHLETLIALLERVLREHTP